MGYSKYKTSVNATVYLYDGYYDFLEFNKNIGDVILKDKRTKAYAVWQNSLSDFNVRFIASIKGDSKYGTTDADEILNEIRDYKFANELVPEINKIQTKYLSNIDINIQQKKEIKFTSQEIGIFSFDLASLGLIRVFEYYSPLLKSVIDANYVRSYKTPNGDIIFYHVYVSAIPEHILEQRDGKLYSVILNRFVNKDDAVALTDEDGTIYFVFTAKDEIPKHNVQQVQKVNDDGNKVFSSTWKKSFIYIPESDKYLPQIDLISVASFSSYIETKDMFWSAVALNAIVKILEDNNVRFRCFSGIAVSTTLSYNQYGFVKIKDLNDAIDRNILSILSADARFFRHEGFKWAIASAYDNGAKDKIKTSIGMPITNSSTIKTELIEALKQKKDYGSSMEDTLSPKTKIIIPSVSTEKEAYKAIEDAINQIKGL